MKETVLLIRCFTIYTLLLILLEGLKNSKPKMGNKVAVHNFGWKV